MIFTKAISYSLLYRVWQAGAGLVTIPLVLHFLEPVVQGYYYTFASVVAMQSFFELGMSIVISVYASHEWHRLHLDKMGRIAGHAEALSRLVSLGRLIFRYFGTMSACYLVCAGVAGIYILRSGQQQDVDWIGPWILHMLFSAGSLWLVPFLSLMEGCDQVAHVSKFRLVQALVSNVALWVALCAGYGLWALPVSSGIGLALLGLHLCVVKRSFFLAFRRAPSGATLSWKSELLPMQWRLAVQALFGYLSFPLYTILAYHYFGAVQAGRVGMTLQVIAGIQSFSLVFILARAPEFALLAASGKAAVLLGRWRRASALTVGVMAGSCLMVGAALWLASRIGWQHASRLLSGWMFLVLATGVVLAGIIQCVAMYLRAHKRELLTPVGTLCGVLYGMSAWLACMTIGLPGLAASYLMVTALVGLPITLLIARANHPALLGRTG